MKYTFDADFKKMYITLFNATTDAIEQMQKHNFGIATEMLLKAQQDC